MRPAAQPPAEAEGAVEGEDADAGPDGGAVVRFGALDVGDAEPLPVPEGPVEGSPDDPPSAPPPPGPPHAAKATTPATNHAPAHHRMPVPPASRPARPDSSMPRRM
ncbi:hypothetical protein [Streptomyces sp. NPDC001435]|uniref:hypothetical protein n=1 Tax=Streptomyces sp. NPDC001435 TaxID=3364576 RepID=UPI0036AC8A16